MRAIPFSKSNPKKNSVQRNRDLFLFGVLVLLIFFLTGCMPYRQYTFRNNISDSSFEYSSSYVVTKLDKGSNNSTARVYLNLINPDPNGDFAGNINVSVKNANQTFPTYLEFLEFSLDIAQHGQDDDEYSLIERIPITVDGKSGEKIIYTYHIHDPDGYEIVDGELNIIEPIPAIAYEAYFDSNGKIWNIEMHTTLEYSENTKQHFQRIISSFKLLDNNISNNK